MPLLPKCLTYFGAIWVMNINTTLLIGAAFLEKKDFGGMGVPNLRDFNLAVLASWSKRFFDDKPSGDWKKLLSFKYITNKPNILWAKPGLGSPFWKSISWAFSTTKPFYKWKLGNGHSTVGMTLGLGTAPLKHNYGFILYLSTTGSHSCPRLGWLYFETYF